MNKVTFRADLRDAIILSKEEQKEADCGSLQSIKEFCQFQYIDFDSNQDSSPLSFQPFILHEMQPNVQNWTNMNSVCIVS